MVEVSLPKIEYYCRMDPAYVPKSDVLDAMYYQNTNSLHVTSYMRKDRYINEFQSVHPQQPPVLSHQNEVYSIEGQYPLQPSISYHLDNINHNIREEYALGHSQRYADQGWKECRNDFHVKRIPNQSQMCPPLQFSRDYSEMKHIGKKEPVSKTVTKKKHTSLRKNILNFTKYKGLGSPFLTEYFRGKALGEDLPTFQFLTRVTKELIEGHQKRPTVSPDSGRGSIDEGEFFNCNFPETAVPVINEVKKNSLGKRKLCNIVDALHLKKVNENPQHVTYGSRSHHADEYFCESPVQMKPESETFDYK